MTDQKPFRVVMWCVPRTASTAVAKCLTALDNTQVWFDPYGIAAMQESSLKMMAVEMPKSWDEFRPQELLTKLGAMVKGTPLEEKFKPELYDTSVWVRDGCRRQLEALPAGKSVFVKDMAYGVTGHLDLLPSKASGLRHTFLIRDPARMFPSWRKILIETMKAMPMPGQKPPDEATFDLTTDHPLVRPGMTYKCQYDLWKYVKENLDPNPVVIDTDDLLAAPAAVLSRYFKECGMPWDEKLLKWDASADVVKKWKTLFPLVGTPNDDTIKISYGKAFASSSFTASAPKIPRSEMTPDVIKAVDETSAYYNEMAATKIRV
ncbi:uncharacterized protein [Diadema antillarum]|uniref:uncharacterized protein n=1 Tax=Diadema antillarum TaxID=105358 RepID=UPI003A870E0E